ncbi:uncharacterized protein BO87DRAFT_382005 [Aspergillus neoniger CBS 115656]|uniref:Uncharacterized protein n=1 Tax=Aspergillus neoniger (strain CBS 115656) TaxID=1448310 RepID=A0A318YZG2_ASPNB|nr:hypothetical protein BO87DRAFT_382005 [Aspergillus neoniger CBS 115656]PYH39999.1 hypothetical protein BO87DRAFT_382005 [Aspergillus neoniger CBS 115656]
MPEEVRRSRLTKEVQQGEAGIRGEAMEFMTLGRWQTWKEGMERDSAEDPPRREWDWMIWYAIDSEECELVYVGKISGRSKVRESVDVDVDVDESFIGAFNAATNGGLRSIQYKAGEQWEDERESESRRHKPVTQPSWVARKDGGGGQMLLSITNAPLLRGGKALARSTTRTMKWLRICLWTGRLVSLYKGARHSSERGEGV